MKINAKIVADSVGPNGDRIITYLLTYPRIIHSELLTHRMFGRNASSSRAIPFKKMVKSVKGEPFVPIAWQKDHSGMQGTEYFEGKWEIKLRNFLWLTARTLAVWMATFLHKLGVTKQLANRLLEPFQWYSSLVTATEYENFFALRCPRYKLTSNFVREDGSTFWEKFYRSKRDLIQQSDMISLNGKPLREVLEFDWLKLNKGKAEIHLMALAEAMWDARNDSMPKILEPGNWHIPFSDEIIQLLNNVNSGNNSVGEDWMLDKIKISTAMCARTSYTVVGEEGKPIDWRKDIKLHDMLKENGHMSPFEHCGRAMSMKEYYEHYCGRGHSSNIGASGYTELTIEDSEEQDYGFGFSGNLKGFIQYRKMIPGENITTTKPYKFV